MSDNIILQTGRTIDECISKLQRFCVLDASYKNYDLVTVNEDNSLEMSDIRLANHMGARMGQKVIQSVMDRAENINSALTYIPAGVELSNDAVPWITLENLFRATLGSQIHAARATKILHKKRPYLIPILDSVMVSYCQSVKRHSDKDESTRMIECVRIIKSDIERNLDTFRGLITAIPTITVVRAHDILIWAYSEEYQKKFGVPPLWQR